MTRPQNIEYGPQPWGEKEWCSIIITEEHVAIHKVIECLGLKLANQPGRKIKFEHEDCSTLAKKVADLSRELALDLQKKPNTSSETSNLLFAFAKKQSSLKNELENLLKEHGSRIWGESVARSHLLEPDPSTKYTGDLFYENEGHKNILEENIRRWIILKTFNAIKGAKKSKKRDNDKQITGGNNEGLKRQISTVLANPNNDGRYLTAVKWPRTFSSTQMSTPGSSAAARTGGFTAVNSLLFAGETPKDQLRKAASGSSQELQRCISGSVCCHSDGYSHSCGLCPPGAAPSLPATDSPRSAIPAPYKSAPVNYSLPPSASTCFTDGGSRYSKNHPLIHQAQHSHTTQTQSLPQGVQQQILQISRPHDRQQILPPSHPQFQHQQPAPLSPNPYNPLVCHFGHSLAPHLCSKFSTPLMHAATNQPTTALDSQPKSPPFLHDAAAYSPQPIPIHEAPHLAPAISRQQGPHQDLCLLQSKATAGLSELFFPRHSMPPDELALIRLLHSLWFHCESLFRSELATHYGLVSEILNAWLREREAIVTLRHSMAANPSVPKAGLVDRILVMNELRAMRLRWKNMSPIDGMSPEDLLCMAFKVITNTEGSEYLFKDGLAKLELSVLEFLSSDDNKIILQRLDTRAI